MVIGNKFRIYTQKHFVVVKLLSFFSLLARLSDSEVSQQNSLIINRDIDSKISMTFFLNFYRIMHVQ